MALDIEQIEASFAAISPKLDELTMAFYSDLFDTHPEMEALFGSVDLVRQRRKLAAMLTLIVTTIRRMDVLVSTLRALGAGHVAYGATPENYRWVETSLLGAMRRVAGDLWTKDMEQAWRTAIGLVSREMQAGAAQHTKAGDRQVPQTTDLDLLMEIASNPLLSFERNSLFASYVEKKKTDHEMMLARSVQQSLIPSGFPAVAGYEFSASYEPAAHVGGDYYDWIMPDADHVCFLVGDVSGKGVPGALIMCRLAGAARALLSTDSDTTRALGRINSHLCDRMPGGRFVTLACLCLHVPSHRFTLVSAGHLPAVHRKADGAASYVDHAATGFPVGIEQDASYQAVEGIFELGDSLVLYTDGVSEAMDPEGSQYGMDRLRHAVASANHPAAAGAALLSGVRDFVQGRAASDDLTILTISRSLNGHGDSVG